MNQKGFVNIALIILVVIIAEMAGYFALHKTPSTPASQCVDQIQNPTQTKVTKSEIKKKKKKRFFFSFLWPRESPLPPWGGMRGGQERGGGKFVFPPWRRAVSE